MSIRLDCFEGYENEFEFLKKNFDNIFEFEDLTFNQEQFSSDEEISLILKNFIDNNDICCNKILHIGNNEIFKTLAYYFSFSDLYALSNNKKIFTTDPHTYLDINDIYGNEFDLVVYIDSCFNYNIKTKSFIYSFDVLDKSNFILICECLQNFNEVYIQGFNKSLFFICTDKVQNKKKGGNNFEVSKKLLRIINSIYDELKCFTCD